jgi:regulator of sirC expression with transglutaminase-like and TPR domain
MPANEELLRRWRELVADGEPDLLEGSLLVSLLVDPTEDVAAARRAIASLAARVREGREGLLPSLLRVLFEEEGFRGDAESYDEPSNSSVARVLARRRGMPITLSIVTIEVGRLAGLDLAGIGLPGHFVVGGPALPGGRYLDPFDGGEVGDAERLSGRLAAIFGAPVALGEGPLRTDSPRAILERVLLNLRRSYERRNRWAEALAALELSEALEPESGPLLRERGLLLLKCGRNAEALVALEEYVETAGADDAEPVARLIEAVRESGDAPPAVDEKPARRIFTLGEARELLPRVRELTADAVERFGRLPAELEDERRELVEEWARELEALGLEIKGLWLVDFDSGAGYYCWKYPEPALDHFHGYEEGFAGRLALQ